MRHQLRIVRAGVEAFAIALVFHFSVGETFKPPHSGEARIQIARVALDPGLRRDDANIG